MIYTVRVTNYRDEVLTLDLQNPYASGFAVISIEGLGPEKAIINTVEIASSDGAVFNSARVKARNIVITLKFMGLDIEACRRKTYRFFPLKKPLTLEFVTENRSAKIVGYTESNSPNIFSKDEMTQISIICPKPPFVSTGDEQNEVMFYGEEPLFEFPFENDGLEAMIEFGSIHHVTEANVEYEGDAETGATFVIHALGPAKNIRIDNLDTGDFMAVTIDLIKGDDLIITTMTGEKRIVLLRDGVQTNVLNSLDKHSTWFQLLKGDNAFAYRADEGLNNLQFLVRYDTLYEGM